ncbi:MAG: radical SAM protein [Duncaniella sp.]|nr:radical SAM protein [Duncaniella sp.]MDE6582047.1 radical SAM protein [Duncaniella sp.]
MTIIVKPTYACNFRCKYCYLSSDTKTSNQTIDVEFMKGVISQVKEIVCNKQKRPITFIWHGGEPLLWGIENYREVFSFMNEELHGINYKNAIQTNLSLISEDYIDLFLQHNIRIGCSLDGTKEINDSLRVTNDGNGTFSTIMEKIALCKSRGIDLGCIIVGNKKHIGHIPELFHFLSEKKLNFKFNPLFKAGEAADDFENLGITPDEYAEMCAELFDLWFYDNKHQIKESNFEEIAANLISHKPSYCIFGKNCQDNFFAIAPTGDVMPCGRFCDTDLLRYSYGNLHSEKLADVLPRIKYSDTYLRSEHIEHTDCKKCRYFDICHGGCLHDGFIKSGDFKSKTFLCSAYKRIFQHIETQLNITLKTI